MNTIYSIFKKTLYIFSFTLLFSACLTPRTQLKADASSAEEKGATNKIQEVKELQGSYAIDELKSEITRLSGRIEDLERSQKQPSNNPTKEDLKKLETRIIELEQAQIQILENLKKMQESAPVDPSFLLDKGREQADEKNYEGAIESLSAYLKNSKTKHAEEAYFLRGDAYFHTKQYEKAINDFGNFPRKFTTSKYMAQALYKIGQSFEALGNKEDARGFYQELLEKFPKSPEAKKLKPKKSKVR